MENYDDNCVNNKEGEITEKQIEINGEKYNITTSYVNKSRLDIQVKNIRRYGTTTFQGNFSIRELKKDLEIVKLVNRIEEGKYLIDTAIKKNKIELTQSDQNSIDIKILSAGKNKITLEKRKLLCSSDENDIIRLENDKAELTNEQNELRKELFDIKRELKENIIKNEKLREKIKPYQRDNGNYTDENVKLRKKIYEIKNNNQRLRKQVGELKEKQEDLKTELENLKMIKYSVKKSKYSSDNDNALSNIS